MSVKFTPSSGYSVLRRSDDDSPFTAIIVKSSTYQAGRTVLIKAGAKGQSIDETEIVIANSDIIGWFDE